MMANNIFYNNGSGSQIIDEESKIGTVWDYNLHYPDSSWPPKQPEFDQHSLFGVEPRFVNPAAADYRLQISSPAIEAGLALPEFNYDREFVTRPQGQAWDIGPHEMPPEVELRGRPGNQTIALAWDVNLPAPISTTWRIAYYTTTLAAPLTVTLPLSTTREHLLTGLTNYQWYTVTLHALVNSTAWLSDTVRVMPTDIFVYLPEVRK
jgi:hypothetical protein